jgi:hypothetical protein
MNSAWNPPDLVIRKRSPFVKDWGTILFLKVFADSYLGTYTITIILRISNSEEL